MCSWYFPECERTNFAFAPPFFIVPHWNHVKINCSANRINLTKPSRIPALNSHNKNELDLEVILRTWHGEATVEGVICLS